MANLCPCKKYDLRYGREEGYRSHFARHLKWKRFSASRDQKVIIYYYDRFIQRHVICHYCEEMLFRDRKIKGLQYLIQC